MTVDFYFKYPYIGYDTAGAYCSVCGSRDIPIVEPCWKEIVKWLN